jgi:hypothetical protein
VGVGSFRDFLRLLVVMAIWVTLAALFYALLFAGCAYRLSGL